METLYRGLCCFATISATPAHAELLFQRPTDDITDVYVSHITASRYCSEECFDAELKEGQKINVRETNDRFS